MPVVRPTNQVWRGAIPSSDFENLAVAHATFQPGTANNQFVPYCGKHTQPSLSSSTCCAYPVAGLRSAVARFEARARPDSGKS